MNNDHSNNNILENDDNFLSIESNISNLYSTEDINLRAAFIHVIGDLIQSIGVLIASAVIWYNEEWKIMDPVCTILFSIVVLISTIYICRDIILILMEGN